MVKLVRWSETFETKVHDKARTHKDPKAIALGSLTPILKNLLFLREKFLNLRLLHEKFIENVSASLWRLVHTNALYHFLTALTGSEGCDRFLCHSLILLRYLISR